MMQTDFSLKLTKTQEQSTVVHAGGFAQKSDGFSLVEIMVAMVIGLLGIIIMMQVYSNFEAQKRITAGGDDAQNTGAIALHGLERDIQQSGWGISASGVLGCTINIPASGVIVPARSFVLAPVTINPLTSVIPAGDTNTDTMLIVYGNGNGGQEGDLVSAAPPTGMAGINTYAVGSPNEFKKDDWVITRLQAQPLPCTLPLDTVTAVDPVAPNVTVLNGVAAMTGGTLYNVGKAMSIFAYAIRNGNLTVCDYWQNDCANPANTVDSSIWVPIATNVVSMRAQYGHDTTTPAIAALPAALPFPTYKVDLYDQVTPANTCGWWRTPSIRLVLVARNSQAKQTGTTPVPPGWGGGYSTAASGPLPGNVAAPIVLSQDPNWDKYRYKVFETIIPIRNITTMWMQPSC